MSTTYIPVATAFAADLSRAMYLLSRPSSVRNAKDASVYFCGWIDHPADTGWSVLVVPEDAALPIHPEFEVDLLQQLFAQFVTDGQIPAEEVTSLSQSLAALGGQTIQVLDFIPASWRGQSLDEAAARAAGFLVTE